MAAGDDPVTILSASECWNLLADVALGRLVTVADGQPEIFPINFAVQRKTVLFRTAEGTKLTSAAINNRVLFEADAYTESAGWSVVVRGTARSVRTREGIAEAEQAGLPSWIATERLHYVRILPTAITGRRFRFDPAHRAS